MVVLFVSMMTIIKVVKAYEVEMLDLWPENLKMSRLLWEPLGNSGWAEKLEWKTLIFFKHLGVDMSKGSSGIMKKTTLIY